MVQKIEESFNYVWYVSKPRSFARRFTEYMLVLLIGPVVVIIALGAIASLQNEAFFQWLAANAVFGPLFAATSSLTPFLLVTGVFTFLYWYMPNTNVNLRSALVGGVAGGFMWAAVGMVFAAFVANSARTQAIYASFAISITTLIWLYLNWLILLIGSQLAFYFQNPAYLRLGRREPRLSNAMRERLALNVMLLVGRTFRDADSTIDLKTLSERLSIPSLAVAPLIEALEDRGLLTATEEDVLLPGRDMKMIRLGEILDTVRIEGETGSFRPPQWADAVTSLGRSIDAAIAETVGDRSLSDLLDAIETEQR